MNLKHFISLGLMILLSQVLFTTGLRADDEDRLTQTRFSVNFQNADVGNLLALIAAQTGLYLRADKELGILVTMKETDATAKEILDRLSSEQNIDYKVDKGQLFVSKRTSVPGGSQGFVHRLPLKFADAKEVMNKVLPLIASTDKIIADEHANALLLIGSDEAWRRVSEVVGMLDVAETQILIESQILETSDEVARNLGVSLGSQLGNNGITTSNPLTVTPNLTFSGVYSAATGHAFNVQLQAAETKGTAKVVSRPKVLTLNNKKAKVESGVTINVKTLSTAISNPLVAPGSTSTGTAGLAATSGITTINAGLTLEIVPTVVGTNLIKLQVDINDSTPDTTDAVDGVPAVQNNSASTSIIVKSGDTAVIAGLIKQSKNTTTTGVPFLSSIPLLGILFGSTSKDDTNNELVILITPTIDDGHLKMVTSNP